MLPRLLRTVLLPLCALGLLAFALSALRAHAAARRPAPIETRFDVPPFPAEVARPFSFGFRAFAADVAFIQAIQVYGGRKGSVTYADGLLEDHQIARLLTYATDLDPQFRGAYRFAGNALPRHTLDGKAAGVLAADQLLAKGIRNRQDDWQMWFQLGFLRAFYLNENLAAAEAMREAARLPGSPRYLGMLAARLAANADDLKTAESLAREMLAQASEDSAKAEWEERLVEIETEARARVIDRAAQRYKDRVGAFPASLAALVQGGDLHELPLEPQGGIWSIDSLGLARSDKTRRLRLTAHGNLMGLEVR